MVEKSSYSKGCEIQTCKVVGLALIFGRLGMQVCSYDLNVKSTDFMKWIFHPVIN